MRLGVIFILVVGVVCSAAVDQKPSRKSSWTGKLLVVPMDGSHWTGVKAVAEEMGRRGHTVIVVIPEISVLLGPGQHYITKMFSVKYDQKSLNKVLNERVLEVTNPGNSFLSTVIRIVSNLRRMFNSMAATSESLFQDKELIEFLRNENFDAVLTDPVLPMGAILAYNLSVPAVYLLRGMACGLDATATTCPNPSSYIPRFHTRNTDRMSFGERVMNMLMSILEQTVCKFMYRSFEEMIFNFLQRDVSMTEILRTGAVWLMRYDFTLEFPKPLMPNMQFIGGINCGVRNPLTKVSIAHTVVNMCTGSLTFIKVLVKLFNITYSCLRTILKNFFDPLLMLTTVNTLHDIQRFEIKQHSTFWDIGYIHYLTKVFLLIPVVRATDHNLTFS
nr:UDP glucuronosyltransferase 1 family polypeptide b2 short isoform [Danio rerio]